MSATAIPYRDTGPGFPWRLLLAVALLAAIVFGAHAVAKHGGDALAVRQACDNGGEVQRWQAAERPGKFYRVCQLSPTRFGLQVIECTARGPRERTSFVPGASQLPAGSMARVIEYLTAKQAFKVIAGGLCQ